jgi:hypothetical protein
MCRTTDPEQDPLRFRMDLDGDSGFEVDGMTGGDCRRSKRYREGHFEPRVCVTDVDASSLGALHRFQCKEYRVTLK